MWFYYTDVLCLFLTTLLIYCHEITIESYVEFVDYT